MLSQQCCCSYVMLSTIITYLSERLNVCSMKREVSLAQAKNGSMLLPVFTDRTGAHVVDPLNAGDVLKSLDDL